MIPKGLPQPKDLPAMREKLARLEARLEDQLSGRWQLTNPFDEDAAGPSHLRHHISRLKGRIRLAERVLQESREK